MLRKETSTTMNLDPTSGSASPIFPRTPTDLIASCTDELLAVSAIDLTPSGGKFGSAAAPFAALPFAADGLTAASLAEGEAVELGASVIGAIFAIVGASSFCIAGSPSMEGVTRICATFASRVPGLNTPRDVP